MKAVEGLIDFAINSICINSFTFGFEALHYGDNTVMNELQLTCEKIQFIKSSVGRKVDWGDTLNSEKGPKINEKGP